jgi:hypothetical protein
MIRDLNIDSTIKELDLGILLFDAAVIPRRFDFWEAEPIDEQAAAWATTSRSFLEVS